LDKAVAGKYRRLLEHPGIVNNPDAFKDLAEIIQLLQVIDSVPVPANPADITQQLQAIEKAIADLITAANPPVVPPVVPPFIPDFPEGGINWHRFGDIAVFDKFPFSIPKDIYTLVSAIAAPPKEPRFEFQIIPPGLTARTGIGAAPIVIDFTEFDVVRRLFRSGFLVLFIIGLIVTTRKYIWTGG
jgi:hypothetical protein